MVAQQVCRRGGKWNQVADGAKKPLVTFRVLPPYNLCECRQNTQPFLINKNMGIYFGCITVVERMGRMGYLVFVLLGVLWDSCIYGLISFATYLFICKTFILSNIFFWIIISISFLLQNSNYTYARLVLLSHSSVFLFDFSVFNLFLLFFFFVVIPSWSILTLTDSFLGFA